MAKKYFAQQIDAHSSGLSGSGPVLDEDSLENLEGVIKNHPNPTHPWIVYSCHNPGNAIEIIKYIDINKDKSIDL